MRRPTTPLIILGIHIGLIAAGVSAAGKATGFTARSLSSLSIGRNSTSVNRLDAIQFDGAPPITPPSGDLVTPESSTRRRPRPLWGVLAFLAQKAPQGHQFDDTIDALFDADQVGFQHEVR